MPQNQGGNPVFPEVPAEFKPVPNTTYKILSAKDNKTKALTIDKTTNKLVVRTYTGDATQKFNIYQNGDKVAFVVQSTNYGMCIKGDNVENDA